MEESLKLCLSFKARSQSASSWLDCVCIHEAGHMTACEMLGVKAHYCVTEQGYPGVEMEITPTWQQDLAITIAGDLAVAMSLKYPVADTCVALYRHSLKHTKVHNDWSYTRSICRVEDGVREMAKIVEHYFDDAWELISKNILLAHCRFDAFRCLPHVFKLFASCELKVMRKVFWGLDLIDLVKKLEDSETCYVTCKELQTKPI